MKLIIVLMLGLLVLGCVNQAPPQDNTTKPAVITPVNNTNLSSNTSANTTLPSDYTVGLGDQVSVWYALWVEGKVHDTNNATLANESGIYNPKRKYEPFNFTVEFNKGVIDGFVIGVIGMELNETLYFDVSPERGYGPYDPKKVITISRYYEKSLYETIPRSYFDDKNINITKGAGFDTQYGTVFIDSFNDENVTLFYILTPGMNLSVNGIPQQVVSLGNLSATIEYMLIENKTYALPNPATGIKTAYKIVGKTEENITLDSNNALANETLRFRVTLIDAIHVSQRAE
jgi:FKBP-type peptidyl-prolyl cis-trans isomerase 2